MTDTPTPDTFTERVTAGTASLIQSLGAIDDARTNTNTRQAAVDALARNLETARGHRIAAEDILHVAYDNARVSINTLIDTLQDVAASFPSTAAGQPAPPPSSIPTPRVAPALT